MREYKIMPNNESVGKKIVEALKKQAENMESYQLLFLLLKQCEKY